MLTAQRVDAVVEARMSNMQRRNKGHQDARVRVPEEHGQGANGHGILVDRNEVCKAPRSEEIQVAPSTPELERGQCRGVHRLPSSYHFGCGSYPGCHICCFFFFYYYFLEIITNLANSPSGQIFNLMKRGSAIFNVTSEEKNREVKTMISHQVTRKLLDGSQRTTLGNGNAIIPFGMEEAMAWEHSTVLPLADDVLLCGNCCEETNSRFGLDRLGDA
jgi:hypothetical protein